MQIHDAEDASRRLPIGSRKIGSSVLTRQDGWFLLVAIFISALLLAVGRHDYPDLHTILDTGACLLSGMLALLLWDIGRRTNRPFSLWLAASFGVTSLLELIHVMVTADWWGSLAGLAELNGFLRPSTWPPAAHILPIGIGLAIARLRGGERPTGLFLPALLVIAAVLFVAFQYLPTYTAPAWLAITRPALIFVPVLWAAVGLGAWHYRTVARELPALAVSATVLTAGHLVMLYSQAPHDAPAIVAHLGKVCAYLLFLLALMRLASRDMLERIAAERALAAMNEQLEQRVAERSEAVRESDTRHRSLAESLPALVWTCDRDGRTDYLSRQWSDYTGVPEAEQLGDNWSKQIHPEDRDQALRTWSEAVASGSLYDSEFRIRRHDGVYHWFKAKGLPVKDKTGAVIKWFGSNTDIEDIRSAEQRIQAQLERLNLLHQITRAIGERQDLASIFQVAVRSVEEQLPADLCCLCLHYPIADVLIVSAIGVRGATLAGDLAVPERAKIDVDTNGLARCLRGAVVYEPDLTRVAFPFPQRLAAKGMRSLVLVPLQVESNVLGILVVARLAVDSFTSGETEFLRQLSEHVALAAHQAQLYEALQRAYDDLRQSQQTILQQERMRALGQMASGIAHDINNALTPASLYTEALLEDRSLSQGSRATLEVVGRAIDDVAHTVARMREFYRHAEVQHEFRPVSLNQLIPQVVDLTRVRWRDMPMQRGVVIEIELDLATDGPIIMGTESEIREALVNLLVNAVDAMPDGGRITLRTARRTAGSGQADGQVVVEVTDTGAGMDEQTRQRCLEPFFTTKGERGTGLGLAMVYGVVQRHGGAIEIDSVRGRGTTMRLLFAPAGEGAMAPPQAGAPISLPRQNLLLVDDDPLLLKSLGDILEAEGHSVEAANGGKAGIAAFVAAQERGHIFSAVITDLGMPHIDGRRVAAAIKAASPETPVILLTGWGQRLLAEDGVPAHVDRMLSKPPKLRDLREALIALCLPKDQGPKSSA